MEEDRGFLKPMVPCIVQEVWEVELPSGSEGGGAVQYAIPTSLHGFPALRLFVLCRKEQGVEMLRRRQKWLNRRQLQLNEKKTRIVDLEKEGLEFLGLALTWRKARSGKSYLHCEPSSKSSSKLREAIRQKDQPEHPREEPEEVIARVNVRVRGWVGYFHYSNSLRVFDKMQGQLEERIRRWLWKKQAKTEAHYGEAQGNERLHAHYGLISFPMHTKWQNS